MKQIFTLLMAAFFVSAAMAKPVDPAKAKLAGQGFLMSKTQSSSLGKTFSLSLAYTSSSAAGNAGSDGLGKAAVSNYFYVFNVNQTQGFVIISGDDQAIPVLGYSDEGSFDPADMPPHVAKWLDGYKSQMRYIIKNNIPATPEISKEWEELNSGENLVLAKKAGVNPLIATKWDQSPYYNALCPNDVQAGERAVTGCVATAMAQVMKFWKFPKTGTGFHSYNHDKYGTLSASFGSTTYDWNNMPNQVTSSNAAVATLMYHCGVSVDMNYGIASTGGSGAYVISDASPVTNCTEYALKTYFGYKSTLHGEMRENYTDAQWMAMIKGELDAGRPVVYAGFGSGGGHAFVCDGYDNSNFLHFNWGWSGYYDGFFASNALNPGGVGTGGGSGGFNNNHQAVIGIEAPSGNLTYNLEIDNDVHANATTLQYGSAFNIFAGITNSGSGVFIGDITAAILDQNNLVVSYADTLVGANISGGASGNFNFPHPGSYSILPGNYNISLFYRVAGGSWKQIKATNTSISDFVNVEFTYANYIESYTTMVPSPATFVKGDSATVIFNVANASASTFYGYFKVALFNLDGTFAQNIGIYDASVNGLGSLLTYSPPYLKAKADSITVAPGTYLMAVQFYSTSNPGWGLAGSTYFMNPVKINVALPPPPADQYEANDTTTTAYSLPVNFVNNAATITTPGSNCHTGNDYDYYKLTLPAGFAYKVTGKVHDASSATPSSYTLDALISYQVGTGAPSEAFDDVIEDTIKVNGTAGGTVYIKVAPYFTGNTGTYLLDLKVTRSIPATGKDITAFTVSDISGSAAINSGSGTVTLKIKPTASLTALAPVISVSPGASVNPASGVVRDFTNPVTYTVTAEDNTTKTWTVTITKEFPTAVDEALASTGVKIFPNPAKEQVQVDLAGYGLPVSEISVTDLQGRILQKQAVSQGTVQSINTASLKEGVYLIRLTTGEGVATHKLTITK